MGWFWVNASGSTNAASAPPPGCPMHVDSSTTSRSPFRPGRQDSPPSSCPVTSSPSSSQRRRDDDTTRPSGLSKLNPLNYIPSNLSNTREHAEQTVALPLSRSRSSIPRADATDTNWEYPSPQQMYNAMLRKGYTDTPVDAVESMVEVHNFLNEGAWEEIVAWEDIFRPGLRHAWTQCSLGEEEMRKERVWREIRRLEREEEHDATGPQPQLVKFQGRPKDMTPKASMLQALGWVWPAKFGTDPPFDRHDWYVTRQSPSGPTTTTTTETKQIRYVIDYYSSDPDPETGQPVFYLDIRPALDSPTAAVERLMRWSGDLWYRASGASARKNVKE